MPFRSNTFGEKIAQPGTDMPEIEQAIASRIFFDEIELHSADIFTNGDDDFKFGGTLYFTLTIMNEEIDEETGDPIEEPDYHDHSMEFDGFDTIDDVRDFLDTLELPAHSINEVG